MKKIIATMLALTMFVTACNFSLLNVKAAEPEESKKITVYDGAGVYVGEYDSIKEFEKEILGIDSKQRAVPAWIMTALTAYGAITLVVDVTYLLTGVDAKEWARENVIIPFYEAAKTMKLYSVSGGITNPYPPNSYQYHQYNKTNYYWVVE